MTIPIQTARAANDHGITFNMAVRLGMVPGWSGVAKFGFNATITAATDPEDIWEGGGIYNYSTTTDILSIASNNAADTMQISVTGLDANWVEVTQIATLQGTTRVALATPLRRVYRMFVIGATSLIGTVFCYTGTGAVPTLGAATVRAVINNGNNQTQMAIYTIPDGKVGMIVHGESGLLYEGAPSGGEFARITQYQRLVGQVWRVKKTVGLTVNGTSIYHDLKDLPDPLPARTDIRITVSEVSATMGAWATFDLLLADEDQFPDAYLANLGQPGY